MKSATKILEDLLPPEAVALVDEAKSLDGQALAEKVLVKYSQGIEHTNDYLARGCGDSGCMDFDPGT